MSRQNIRQGQRYNNKNNPQQKQQTQPQQQSSDQIQIPIEAQEALDAIKKARANRSKFMNLESNVTYTLRFDPSKMHVEEKDFNGQKSQRIAHSVINIEDEEAGEKVLSLTFIQSEPIEDALEHGYTEIEITKQGEGFGLTYDINPLQ